MRLIHIVHELRLAAGSRKKLDILRMHEDNEMWKKFLLYTYHPHITYGVAPPKMSDFDAVTIDQAMFDEFDSLSAGICTGNAAKSLANMLSTIYGEIPRLILGKSIKAGVSIATINKAYPELIPVFETMKGRDVSIDEYPVWTSIKFDGVKLFVIVRENTTIIQTSSGLEMKLPSLSNEFNSAVFGVYEGELTHKEGKMVHRPIITGHLNSLLAGTKTDVPDYKFRIYDFIPLEEWDSQTSTTPFHTRQKVLESQFTTGFQDSAHIALVDQYLHHDWYSVENMFNDLIALGYEGTMSRYGEDVYVFKRVDRLIKKKAIKEAVLKCIATTPHTNPAKGIVGSLTLEGVITDKVHGEIFVTVNTGSGLSKFDINCDPEKYIGEDIEILYNSVTQTDSGYSLFLPRFKRICAS